MNIVSWNVRGLGRPAKRFLVKDFLSMHFADICCLQESKLEMINPSVWREIGGLRIDKYVYSPEKGSAGGIILGWNSAMLSGNIVFVGEFSVTADFCSLIDKFQWRCTTVYGPNASSRKLDFWEEIRKCENVGHAPWVICGDFNAIFDKEEMQHNYKQKSSDKHTLM
ncbi:Exodeoxyribonuclease III protein [Dioscorea alata]|uniref:Exodeoxyribonuclease III protein n=1 Tax=Dioscorea alata TaxID=55571 RepID=A0ACB7UYH0_DIOAL|nr:Exodeoxyribonuclease III protein [Dioscorea alata]